MSDFNPFAALIQDQDTLDIPKRKKPINDILEEIFAFTLNPNVSEKKHIIYLEEVAKGFARDDLDLGVLQHALFDRLFMCTENNSVISSVKKRLQNPHSFEVKVLTYLCNCYRNLIDDNHLDTGEVDRVKSLIMENAVTAVIQSDIYQGQEFEQQLVDILKENSPHCITFFKAACRGILDDDEGGEVFLKNKMSEILLILTSEIEKQNLATFNYDIFNALNVFSSEEYLASIFLDVKPIKFDIGSHYALTPLGAILNTSILPKTPSAKYQYYEDPTDQASNISTEGIVWNNTDKLTEHIHGFVLSLLTCSPQIKNKTLEWLGLCLKANLDRGKLWNAHSPDLHQATYSTVSDGFMVNFGNVMLRLCRPFCSNFKDKKILKVDPTYCSVPNDQCTARGVHLPGMTNETCLIPHEPDVEGDLLLADKYNFVTECFYFAHKTINLGYHVAVDKLMRLNHEVSRFERAYGDAVAQAAGNNDLVDNLKRTMTQSLTKYLSLKAQLSDPVLMALLFEFTSASTYWLCQVAVKVNFDPADQQTFAPVHETPVLFPLPDLIPQTLKSIPEFIIENIVGYLVFLKRFNPKVFEGQGFDKLEPILSFILIYMGSPERVKNPHMRARLAEALDALLPHHEDVPPSFNAFGAYQRELLFTQHENRNEIVNNLLKVFVGIEMTGQSVEFEQKFNYRRPMYTVMDYLWTREEYRTDFKNLAKYAEENMNAVDAPLFLRFINLLINDAVYLLDESLANMAKLKDMQTAKENGEWESLSAQERAQQISHMTHIGMIARFDNILGKDTIKTLEKLTSEITIVFTHPTIVERVPAMLNYFLSQLVGPKKKTFKVKDQKEYSFDPATMVLNICKIYVNFKESDSFCLAILKDGRSYSPELFELAEDVLVRIGGGALIGELKEVAERVARKARGQQVNEEAMSEAPEHFLDPIMSTIMTDPVILPSSKQTVDRATIARHLLSDQTDPFNRAPLSMDQVIPNTELIEEMRKWLEEREKK